jgi:hypothetical protein
VLVALIAAGPTWATAPELGSGTANVSVVSPAEIDAGHGDSSLVLRTTPGRFGTSATYLRIPDLVVDASNVDGTPRLVYGLEVRALDVDRLETRLLPDPGRLRVPMADRAYPPPDFEHDAPGLPEPGTYEGRLVVRVQSYTSDRIVVNRTVEVIVDP